MTDSDRRYTDQEVALVLAKASELEEGRALTSTSGRGLTLRELHEIAKEVGLSPRAIDVVEDRLPSRESADQVELPPSWSGTPGRASPSPGSWPRRGTLPPPPWS